jgi:hypothetical protein
VTVEFTEPGPLGLDFSLEKLAGGKFGLAIKGIAEGSHAAAFPQLKPGMRLLSVDDESGGVVVKTELKASSPYANAPLVSCRSSCSHLINEADWSEQAGSEQACQDCIGRGSAYHRALCCRVCQESSER